MSRQHRSINQRLRRAKTPEVKRETAIDWANEWRAEQAGLVKALGHAIARDEYDDLCRIAGQIKAVTEKRFAALPKVIDALVLGIES